MSERYYVAIDEGGDQVGLQLEKTLTSTVI